MKPWNRPVNGSGGGLSWPLHRSRAGGKLGKGEPRRCASPRGKPAASAATQRQHADTRQVRGGQLHGGGHDQRGGSSSRRGPRRLPPAPEVPVHPGRVPGADAGRGGVLGRPRRQTHPYCAGDRAVTVGHRLRRVSSPTTRDPPPPALIIMLRRDTLQDDDVMAQCTPHLFV